MLSASIIALIKFLIIKIDFTLEKVYANKSLHATQ